MLERLKPWRARSDKRRMFHRIATAPALSEACLQSLHVSLNAPVVRVEGAPVAEARAVIVAYAEDYGGLALALGLRPLAEGEVLIFKYRDPIADRAQLRGAVDAAFDLGESMGFLFDDDMLHPVSTEARRRALQCWNRLMCPGFEADEAVSPDGAELAPQPAEAELLLDDLADLAGETGSDLLGRSEPLDAISPAPAAASGSEASAARVSDPPPAVLSKFRTSGNESADRPADPVVPETPPPAEPVESESAVAEGKPASSSTLGQIPIVRMRRRSDSARPGLIARLLASF